MKYLSILFLVFSTLQIQAQIEEIKEIQTLMSEFEKGKDLATLTLAEEKLEELFSKKMVSDNLSALTTKAKVKHAVLEHGSPETPVNYAQDLTNTYRLALESDRKMSQRHLILRDVYKSKNMLITIGNDTYTSGAYKEAHGYFEQALALNTIERDFPRHVVLDTSILFSKAVIAKLAEEDQTSIKDLERLVELEYNREEIYDYLVELYGKKSDDKNLERIKKLKELKFPKK